MPGSKSLALTMVDLDNPQVDWIQTNVPSDGQALQEQRLT